MRIGFDGLLIRHKCSVRLYDTNNPLNEVIRQRLKQLERDGEDLVIVPQVLVEFWAVATRPVSVNGLGMTTEKAEMELGKLQKLLKVLPENEKIFDEWRTLVGNTKSVVKPPMTPGLWRR